MKIDISRPDKLFISGIKTLSNINLNLYSKEKSDAKGKAELAFIGERKIEKVQTQLYTYDSEISNCTEELQNFDILSSLDKNRNYWLNIHGLHDVDLIQEAGKRLLLDRISIRQILDTTLRPKAEAYDNYILFSVKSVNKDEFGLLVFEQLSFVLGENYVVSFQEKKGDHFDSIRHRIDENLGLTRKRNTDFLLYLLLDAILENYFETIEALNADIKMLEKEVLANPVQSSLIQLESLKQVSEMINNSLRAFKESIRVILNSNTVLIRDENKKYFNDLVNTCINAIEEIERTIGSINGITNIYFSSLSQKMNETMKILTTVATIFIPLTFIAGIYGMNFENMPELKSQYGYFYALGGMAILFIAMLAFFKWRKWL